MADHHGAHQARTIREAVSWNQRMRSGEGPSPVARLTPFGEFEMERSSKAHATERQPQLTQLARYGDFDGGRSPGLHSGEGPSPVARLIPFGEFDLDKSDRSPSIFPHFHTSPRQQLFYPCLFDPWSPQTMRDRLKGAAGRCAGIGMVKSAEPVRSDMLFSRSHSFVPSSLGLACLNFSKTVDSSERMIHGFDQTAGSGLDCSNADEGVNGLDLSQNRHRSHQKDANSKSCAVETLKQAGPMNGSTLVVKANSGNRKTKKLDCNAYIKKGEADPCFEPFSGSGDNKKVEQNASIIKPEQNSETCKGKFSSKSDADKRKTYLDSNLQRLLSDFVTSNKNFKRSVDDSKTKQDYSRIPSGCTSPSYQDAEMIYRGTSFPSLTCSSQNQCNQSVSPSVDHPLQNTPKALDLVTVKCRKVSADDSTCGGKYVAVTKSAKRDFCGGSLKAEETESEKLLKYAEVLYKCSLCTSLPTILTSKSSFMGHMLDHHLGDAQTNQDCPQCHLKFSTEEDLRAHQENSHSMAACSDCLTPQKLTKPNHSPVTDVDDTSDEGSSPPSSAGEKVKHLQHLADPVFPSQVQASSSSSEKPSSPHSGIWNAAFLSNFTPEFGRYTKLVREGGNIVYFCQVCNWKCQVKTAFQVHCNGIHHHNKVRIADQISKDKFKQPFLFGSLVPPSSKPASAVTNQQSRNGTGENRSQKLWTDRDRMAKGCNRLKAGFTSSVKNVEGGENSVKHAERRDAGEELHRANAGDSRTQNVCDSDKQTSVSGPGKEAVSNRNKRKHSAPVAVRNSTDQEDAWSDTESEEDIKQKQLVRTLLPKHSHINSDSDADDEASEVKKLRLGVGKLNSTSPDQQLKQDCNSSDGSASQKFESPSRSPASNSQGRQEQRCGDDSNRCKSEVNLNSGANFESDWAEPSEVSVDSYPYQQFSGVKEDESEELDDTSFPCSFCDFTAEDLDAYKHHVLTVHDLDLGESCFLEGRGDHNSERLKISQIRNTLAGLLVDCPRGNVSRDLLLQKISLAVGSPGIIHWGSACNKAVREEFPNSLAQRKGKFKKTYFFGVTLVEQLQEQEELSDPENMSFRPLRDMSQDLEQILEHLPSVVCWSDEQSMGISRDEVLIALADRIGEGEVNHWGVQCNRAVRMLFPQVIMKRKGKHKTTVYFGIDFIHGSLKQVLQPCKKGRSHKLYGVSDVSPSESPAEDDDYGMLPAWSRQDQDFEGRSGPCHWPGCSETDPEDGLDPIPLEAELQKSPPQRSVLESLSTPVSVSSKLEISSAPELRPKNVDPPDDNETALTDRLDM